MGREISKMAKKLSVCSVRTCQLILCLLAGVFSSVTYSAPESELWPIWAKDNPASTKQISHQKWQDIIDRYLDVSAEDQVYRFDYGGISSDDKGKLESYIADLSGIDPRDYNKDEQLAYWINLYNALTVDLVVSKYPVSSIKNIRSFSSFFGPWNRKIARVAGVKLSLNDIEHRILRPIWKDPRIHFVVNCASIGCPNLQKTVFTSANADSLMTLSTKEFLNHPRALRKEGTTLIVSSLINWYGTDFGENIQERLDYLAQYLTTEKRLMLTDYKKITYKYDWSLPKSITIEE